jgi:hypothetical protein
LFKLYCLEKVGHLKDEKMFALGENAKMVVCICSEMEILSFKNRKCDLFNKGQMSISSPEEIFFEKLCWIVLPSILNCQKEKFLQLKQCDFKSKLV